jgi:hypothetical protein
VLRDELAASESLARLGLIWSDCVVEDVRLRYQRVAEGALGKERAARLGEDEASSARGGWSAARSLTGMTRGSFCGATLCR